MSEIAIRSLMAISVIEENIWIAPFQAHRLGKREEHRPIGRLPREK